MGIQASHFPFNFPQPQSSSRHRIHIAQHSNPLLTHNSNFQQFQLNDQTLSILAKQQILQNNYQEEYDSMFTTFRPQTKLSYGKFKVLCSKITNQKIHEYRLVFKNEHQLKTYLMSYYWRKSLHNQNEFPLVKTVHFKIAQQSKQQMKGGISGFLAKNCSARKEILCRVYVEEIPLRLCHIKDIPFPQNLYVLRQALRGFQIIYENIGYIKPFEDLICINRRGVVKVWINSQLSKNFPNIEHMESNFTVTNGESKLVNEIFQLVNSNSDSEGEPMPLVIFMKECHVNWEYVTFEKIFEVLDRYCVEFGVEVPAVFGSIIEVLNEEEEEYDTYRTEMEAEQNQFNYSSSGQYNNFTSHNNSSKNIQQSKRSNKIQQSKRSIINQNSVHSNNNNKNTVLSSRNNSGLFLDVINHQSKHAKNNKLTNHVNRRQEDRNRKGQEGSSNIGINKSQKMPVKKHKTQSLRQNNGNLLQSGSSSLIGMNNNLENSNRNGVVLFESMPIGGRELIHHSSSKGIISQNKDMQVKNQNINEIRDRNVNVNLDENRTVNNAVNILNVKGLGGDRDCVNGAVNQRQLHQDNINTNTRNHKQQILIINNSNRSNNNIIDQSAFSYQQQEVRIRSTNELPNSLNDSQYINEYIKNKKTYSNLWEDRNKNRNRNNNNQRENNKRQYQFEGEEQQEYYANMQQGGEGVQIMQEEMEEMRRIDRYLEEQLIEEQYQKDKLDSSVNSSSLRKDQEENNSETPQIQALKYQHNQQNGQSIFQLPQLKQHSNSQLIDYHRKTQEFNVKESQKFNVKETQTLNIIDSERRRWDQVNQMNGNHGLQSKDENEDNQMNGIESMNKAADQKRSKTDKVIHYHQPYHLIGNINSNTQINTNIQTQTYSYGHIVRNGLVRIQGQQQQVMRNLIISPGRNEMPQQQQILHQHQFQAQHRHQQYQQYQHHQQQYHHDHYRQPNIVSMRQIRHPGTFQTQPHANYNINPPHLLSDQSSSPIINNFKKMKPKVTFTINSPQVLSSSLSSNQFSFSKDKQQNQQIIANNLSQFSQNVKNNQSQQYEQYNYNNNNINNTTNYAHNGQLVNFKRLARRANTVKSNYMNSQGAHLSSRRQYEMGESESIQSKPSIVEYSLMQNNRQRILMLADGNHKIENDYNRGTATNGGNNNEDGGSVINRAVNINVTSFNNSNSFRVNNPGVVSNGLPHPQSKIMKRVNFNPQLLLEKEQFNINTSANGDRQFTHHYQQNQYNQQNERQNQQNEISKDNSLTDQSYSKTNKMIRFVDNQPDMQLFLQNNKVEQINGGNQYYLAPVNHQQQLKQRVNQQSRTLCVFDKQNLQQGEGKNNQNIQHDNNEQHQSSLSPYQQQKQYKQQQEYKLKLKLIATKSIGGSSSFNEQYHERQQQQQYQQMHQIMQLQKSNYKIVESIEENRANSLYQCEMMMLQDQHRQGQRQGYMHFTKGNNDNEDHVIVSNDENVTNYRHPLQKKQHKPIRMVVNTNHNHKINNRFSAIHYYEHYQHQQQQQKLQNHLNGQQHQKQVRQQLKQLQSSPPQSQCVSPRFKRIPTKPVTGRTMFLNNQNELTSQFVGHEQSEIESQMDYGYRSFEKWKDNSKIVIKGSSRFQVGNGFVNGKIQMENDNNMNEDYMRVQNGNHQLQIIYDNKAIQRHSKHRKLVKSSIQGSNNKNSYDNFDDDRVEKTPYNKNNNIGDYHYNQFEQDSIDQQILDDLKAI